MKTKYKIILITQSIIIAGLVIFSYSMFETIPQVLPSEDDTVEDTELQPKIGDKYYIEPKRKAQLEAVELDLRNKILQLHQKNSLGSFAVNLDHLTKEIVVIVENEQFNTEIEEMISQYPDDIPIVFSNGKIEIIDYSEPELLVEVPSDFNFVYSFGIGEKNRFDSKEELYVADMVCDPSIKIDMQLSKEEKQKIWQSVIENQFFELDDFTETCNAFGMCRDVEPEHKITLSITANSENHSVHFRDAYFGNDKNLSKFNNIIETIQEILDQKDEIKNLPTPKCAYL